MMKRKLLFWFAFLSIGMQAQNINFPDANFKEALLGTNFNNYVICYDHNNTNFLPDQNKDGEIQLSEASLVKKMVFFQISNYTTLEGINSFTNLETIQYDNNGPSTHIHGYIGNINIDALSHLQAIDLSGCSVSKISIRNCPKLLDIDSMFKDSYNTPDYSVQGNTLEMVIDNCPKLEGITWTNNNLGSANIKNVPNLKHLELRGNYLTNFDATQFTNLEYLDLSNNQYLDGPNISQEANGNPSLTTLKINGLVKLQYLDVSNQLLGSLNVAPMTNLTFLNCRNNKISNLTTPNNPDLKHLDCSKNLLTSLNLNNYNLIETLDCSYNQINSLNLNNTGIRYLSCDNNDLMMLDISNVRGLYYLNAMYNKLSSIIFNNQDSTLYNLNINYNNLNSLDLSGQKKLDFLDCSSNNLSVLDVSANSDLDYIGFNNNPNLEFLFMKNGKTQLIGDYASPTEIFSYNTFLNTNIKYICVDESEAGIVKAILAHENKTANVNSYCSFTPGGNYNTISGTVKIDTNNNGCDASDNPFEFLKLKIDDGTTSGETFVQQNGKYEFYTQSGNFNITTLAENPALFNISPANFSTNFVDSNNHISTQDICVTANGTQNDAEVVIAPLTGARPGFDATYKLVWRNKGNTTLSGKVVLNYDHNRMTFQSSSLPYAAISNGSLEFNYSNLKPYANEVTELVFTINTPTNPTNPVNSDDILPFNAQITPNASDVTPEDNNFKFDQKVVNSFDPNEITCMEGEIIPTVAVGKYMHYVVNFENTGTAEAENIVVKMNIDPSEFDINTLQLQNASADVTTKITGNEVEFRFKKIKLKAGGHGNVLLKMKSLTSLQEGDSVNNKADIYFDYNFPITTNDYITTVLDEHSLLNAKINYKADEFTPSHYKINFDASLSKGNIVSYTWEFPNASSVSSTSAVNPIVTYSNDGNYTAKLTISDSDNNLSIKTISFKIGNTSADLSTGRDNNGNTIAIDADDDDWKGFDINGTEITPKIRHTYTGWSFADIGNGNNSQWISLNNFEGYYNYKSRMFTIPSNATDAKLDLRSLSFVRNWTYLVKVQADGSETETEITKTQWQNDGFKGWLNSRSPKVDRYSLSPGTYYIKVLVYSNNSTVRESLDVNAIVTCSTGLMNANKIVPQTITLQTQDLTKQSMNVYPVPTHGELNIDSDSDILSVEVHDAVGRILQKKHFAPAKSVELTISGEKGIYFLRIMTKQGVTNRKILKD